MVVGGLFIGAGSDSVPVTMLLFVLRACSFTSPSSRELHPIVRFPATKFKLIQQWVIVVIDSFSILAGSDSVPATILQLLNNSETARGDSYSLTICLTTSTAHKESE